MRPIFRHCMASLVCGLLFGAFYTADNFNRILHALHVTRPDTWVMYSDLTGFFVLSALMLLVVAPVAAIADYQFNYRWMLHRLLKLPVLLLVIIALMSPWALCFGVRFLDAFLVGAIMVSPPVIVYWLIFRVTDIED